MKKSKIKTSGECINEIRNGRIYKTVYNSGADDYSGSLHIISFYKQIEEVRKIRDLAERASRKKLTKDENLNADICFDPGGLSHAWITENGIECWNDEMTQITSTIDLNEFVRACDTWLVFLNTKPIHGQISILGFLKKIIGI